MTTSTVGRDPNERASREVRQPYIDAATVASVQTIFQRSRLAHQAWRARRAEGRIDGRNVWRNEAVGSVDIFKERKAPSATKLNVWVLVDASGSMDGERACRSQDLVGTLVESFKRIPTVQLHVWQHHVLGSTTQVHRVVAPSINKVDHMLMNVGGGNADGFALKWIGQQALRQQRPDERSLIIVLSDGAPTEHGAGATNHDLNAFSRAVSDELRMAGVGVMAVGIANNHAQSAQMYGEEHTVMFDPRADGAWGDLARGFGRIFGGLVR